MDTLSIDALLKDIKPERIAALPRDVRLKLVAQLAERKKRDDRARQEAPGGLIHFVRYFWDVLEPETKFVNGWAMEAICLHLEAVDDGRIKKLLINVPPGFSKSLIANVFFPAWRWSAKKKPHLRFLSFSYSSHLTERDNAKMRDLIKSPKFQAMYGDRFKLTREGQELVSTDKTGWKFASSVRGVSTGERGDTVTCLPYDEPLFTSNGWMNIGEVVSKRLPVKIAGVINGEIVWQDIAKYETNPGGEIYEIRWASGSVRCTADHPVYVHSRGYVRADEVSPGDEICRVGDCNDLQVVLPANTDQAVSCASSPLLQSSVQGRGGVQRVEAGEQPALPGVQEASVPSAISSGAHAGRPILQPRMSWHLEYGSTQPCIHGLSVSGLSVLRQAVHEAPHKAQMLFAPVWAGASKEEDQRRVEGRQVVSTLRGAIYGDSENTSLLRPQMRQCSSFLSDGRGRERAIPAWRSTEAVPTGLDQDAQSRDQEEGRIPLSSVREEAGAQSQSGCSPHRLREGKPSAGELNNPLPLVPRTDARQAGASCRLATGIVESVTRIGFDPVTYNVNVAPAHNYFAGDGALLHNCDDAHSVKEQESRLVREETVRWFMEGITNRLNNAMESAIIVIMQRLHDLDLAGSILEAKMGYVHLCIPMAYDPSRHCKTSIGWEDPRKVDGELAWVERFPDEAVAQWRKQPYMWASQYQQTPQVRGGNIFRYEWWQRRRMPKGTGINKDALTYVVASLDTAYTTKKINDPSALTVWGCFVDPKDRITKAILLDAWTKHLDLHGVIVEREKNEPYMNWARRAAPKWGLVEWVTHTCQTMNVDKLLIESTAAGHSTEQEMRRLFRGNKFGIQMVAPKGDKEARAHAVTFLFTEGLVYAPGDFVDDDETEWEFRKFANLVISEMARFPKGHDDLTDTASMALKHLRDINVIARKIEARQAEEDERQYSRPLQPLYPGCG